MLTTKVEDGKTYVKVEDVFPSPLNEKLRITEDKDFQQLEHDLEKHGELTPILINSGEHYGTEGEAIGGNTRIKLYRLKKTEWIWVNIISPKDELDFIEKAAIHNGQYSQWNPDGIAEFLMKYRENPDLNAVHFLLSHPVNAQSLLNSYAPPAAGPSNIAPSQDKAKELNGADYSNAMIKQIVTYWSSTEYAEVIPKLDVICKENAFTNYTQVFRFLLQFYEDNQS